MRNEILVSVIIPTYGRPEYLKRAVNSVLEQTHKNVEVIVIDDNNPGTENRTLTENVMQAYITDNRIKYLKHKQNMNGANARNTGIAAAEGKYLALLDDDDEMLPKRIEMLVEKMETLDESWCACYTDFIKKKPNNVEDRCGETREGNLYVEALMRSLYFCPGSNLFARTAAVKSIGGFDGDFYRNQDLEFIARLLENGKLAYLDETLLIIHYEDKPVADKTGKKNHYAKLIELEILFLSKFKSRIDALDPRDRKKVYQHTALERFRFSLKNHQAMDGIKNCIKNKVSVFLFCRYIFYMANRMITKKSYGFRM